jgi:hypothetical protein
MPNKSSQTGQSSGTHGNREVRRAILNHLYETYTLDPHAVLTPQQLEQGAKLTRDEVMRNIFYLEERGFVECMKRYGSRLFAAARIAPDGIDLVEDNVRMAALFGTVVDAPAAAGDTDAAPVDGLETVRRMYIAVFARDLDTETRHAALEDVRSLEFEMRRPHDRRRAQKIECLLDWIEQALGDVHLTETDLIRGLVRHWEQDAD